MAKKIKRAKSSVPKGISGDRALSVIRIPALEVHFPELPTGTSGKARKSKRSVKKATLRKVQKGPKTRADKKIKKPRQGGSRDA
jgi:hypothetical protein